MCSAGIPEGETALFWGVTNVQHPLITALLQPLLCCGAATGHTAALSRCKTPMPSSERVPCIGRGAGSSSGT